ncbi:two-component sensor histidine kinase, partial [bacterium]|nr:two-component sensor histidine kinase [bacterium]
VRVGYVETHSRPETKALLKGLQVYPRGKVDYRGKKLEEFDLDAVLKDKPEVVLVDELAHTNAPGSRHPKRYQDVFELLDNGITVYTTLNVQHINSINEDVRAATGVSVHETIPDEVLDRADEIELVDLTPAELLKRLSEGKVYTPERSKAAIANFFTVPNLTALREQALRVTRGHVKGELARVHAVGDLNARQRQDDGMLLLITPDDSAEQAIRRTRQTAYNQGCRWGVAVIDNGRKMRVASEQQLMK